MNRRRQRLAVILGVVMLLSMLVSSAYIAHELIYRHDCTGANCPICRFIAEVERVRRGFGALLAMLLALCLALAAGGERRAWHAFAPVPCTLVDRKIRLND